MGLGVKIEIFWIVETVFNHYFELMVKNYKKKRFGGFIQNIEIIFCDYITFLKNIWLRIETRFIASPPKKNAIHRPKR